MYSTELIRKFPAVPNDPILYVVYNEEHVTDAADVISIIHGEEYLNTYVTIVPLNTKVEDYMNYSVYIDPTVYKFMHSWND